MSTCPDAEVLEQLLDEGLDGAEQSEVTQHVDGCRRCQEALQRLASGARSWADVAECLRREAHGDAEPALRKVLAELHGQEMTASTAAPAGRDGVDLEAPTIAQSDTDRRPAIGETVDDVVPFLGPPSQPGRLGRLDHYEILEVVGQGGMGTVLKAFDEKLHRIVAVKVMSPRLAASTAARKRFIREAQAAAIVRDDHVVNIHAVEERPLPYLVMEFIDGQSLEAKIRKRAPLEVREVVRIGMQVARGLAAAHAQGFIHRDIKPANILLENHIEKVKITDFGLARAVDDDNLTQSGMVAGTPQYMSPEQADGRPVDHRSDLFSLGSVLYTMCTGQSPFRAATTLATLRRVCSDAPRPIRNCNPDIPDWLDGIVTRLHAKKPEDRFQSADEVVDLLNRCLAHLQQPMQTAPPRFLRVLRPRRRKRWLAAAVGFAAVAAVAVAVAFNWHAWFPAHGEAVPVDQPKLPVQRTAEELSGLPSPLDRLSPEQLLPGPRALAGDGDAGQAPAELVAFLGGGGFATLHGARRSWPAVSPNGKLLAVPCDRFVYLYDAHDGTLVRTLTGHNALVQRVAFSADGKSLAAGNKDGDNTVRVWQVDTGALVATLEGHKDQIFGICFDRDGKRLASSSADGTVKIWDLAARAEQGSCKAGAYVYSVAFSPDGKRLFGNCAGKALYVWDAATGALEKSLPAHSKVHTSLAFSPDGKYLASGSDNEWRLWDANSLEELQGQSFPASWLAFADDHTLLTGAHGNDGDAAVHVVRRWELPSGKQLGRLELKSRGYWSVFALGPDGKTLFSASSYGGPNTVFAHDAATGEEIVPRGGRPAPVHALAFHPDGTLLAAGHADGALQLWRLPECERLGKPTPGGSPIASVAFSPDGAANRLASASEDGSVVLWDAASGRELHRLSGPGSRPGQLAFSPDGRILAVGRADGMVELWDAATGKIHSQRQAHTGAVRAVAFTGAGQQLVTGGDDRLIRVTELDTGKLVTELQSIAPVKRLTAASDGPSLAWVADTPEHLLSVWDFLTHKQSSLKYHTAAIDGLACHPSGQFVATAAHDGRIRLWDVAGGGQKALVFGPGGVGQRVEIAFTAEGRYLAAGYADGAVRILKLAPTGEKISARPGFTALRRLKGHTHPWVEKIVPAGDGAHFLSASSDATVRLWNWQTGKLVRTFEGHQGSVYGVAPTGPEQFVSVGADGFVRRWDWKSSEAVSMIRGWDQKLQAVAVLPGGQQAVIGSNGGLLRLWDLKTGEAEARFEGKLQSIYAVTITPDGKGLLSGGSHKTVSLWDVGTQKEKRRFGGIGKDGYVWAIACTPDGKHAAWGGYADGSVRLWELDTGRLVRIFPHGDPWIRWLSFSADSKRLLTAGHSRYVYLWETATGKELARLDTSALSGCFTQDGRHALVADGITPVITLYSLP